MRFLSSRPHRFAQAIGSTGRPYPLILARRPPDPSCFSDARVRCLGVDCLSCCYSEVHQLRASSKHGVPAPSRLRMMKFPRLDSLCAFTMAGGCKRRDVVGFELGADLTRAFREDRLSVLSLSCLVTKQNCWILFGTGRNGPCAWNTCTRCLQAAPFQLRCELRLSRSTSSRIALEASKEAIRLVPDLARAFDPSFPPWRADTFLASSWLHSRDLVVLAFSLDTQRGVFLSYKQAACRVRSGCARKRTWRSPRRKPRRRAAARAPPNGTGDASCAVARPTHGA